MFRKSIALWTACFICLSTSAFAGDGKQDHANHEDHMADTQSASYELGDLTLTAPFARATLPNQPVAGGFVTITNTGETEDILMSVSSSVSDRGEVHEMAMDGDTMRMRELADGLVIPAGATVELKPGGYHLMFMKLNQPLVEGEMMEATLMFKNAGSVTIPFAIMGKSAKSMDHSGHGS